ncbi:MAG: Glu/Leu/Phe/Val dehydrogenase [Nitrospinales bacterium]
MNAVKLPGQLKVETLPREHYVEISSRQPDAVPEQTLRIFDPADNRTWGYVVIDNTHRGPGLGGVRMAKDLTLDEVARLARAMTLKNSVSRLPFGGGKAGLAADPETINDNPALKMELTTLFAEVLFPVNGYIPAPDMGTNERDMQIIYEYYSQKLNNPRHMRGGAARPPDRGGVPIDEWGLTAHGLFAAAETMERLVSDFRIKNSRVVVQGYGNVGSWIAVKLTDAGAVIVGASDIHEGLWEPGGLDTNQLNSARRKPGGLRNYLGPVKKRFPPPALDALLEVPCDILAPAARPDAVTRRNADRIQCRFILQGANAPSDKVTEYYLQNRRNILSLSDFIVNVGGVIGCAAELLMNTDDAYKTKVLAEDGSGKSYLENLIYNTVSRNVAEIYRRMSDKQPTDRIFREEALALAEERLRSDDKIYWM